MAKTNELDRVTAKVIRQMSGGRFTRLGIREVALAVEAAMGREVALTDVHAAVSRVATFYPSNDPQNPAAKRQYAFRMPHGNDDQDARVWVYERR